MIINFIFAYFCFMQITKYIGELLYRYECVIVPNFGGFVSNVVSATIDKTTQTFTPPSKLISFNINLSQNDGLLANHIAKSEKISYEEALNKIADEVSDWNVILMKETLELPKIGTLAYQDTQLVFEPYKTTNFLTSSFGLDTVKSSLVFRKGKVVITKTHKTVAAVAAVLAIGWFGNTAFNYTDVYNQYVSSNNKEEEIQQATFNILKPLSKVTVKIEEPVIETVIEEVENNTIVNFSIIAGAFKNPENADKLLESLKEKGYNATIAGVNKWGLTQVSYGDFSNREEATTELTFIKENENASAWLLVH